MTNPSQGTGGTRDHTSLLNRNVVGQHTSESAGVLISSSINPNDIGENWTDLGVISTGGAILRGASSLGNGIAVIGDANGRLYRSSDFGRTWTNQGIITSLTVDSSTIFTSSYMGNGIILFGDINGNLFRSTDFGLTWSLAIAAGSLNSIFTSAYVGNGIFLAGSVDGRVSRSTTFGVFGSWTTFAVTPGFIDSITYLDNGIVILTDNQGHIFRSTNFGAAGTWTDLGDFSASSMLGSVYLSNGVVLASDGLGHIFRSTDYGLNWTDLGSQSNGGSAIQTLSYIGNGIVIFGDFNGHVFKSTDYGLTWADIGSGGAAISGTVIRTIANCNGTIIVGDNNGHIFYSDVSYKTDETRATVLDDLLDKRSELVGVLSPSSINHLDIGKNWFDMGILSAGTINTISYLGNGIVIAGDSVGHVFRSVDFGSLWIDEGNLTGGDAINRSLYLGSGRVVFSTNLLHVFISFDFGVTWIDEGVQGTEYGFSYLGNRTVICGGNTGIRRSTNLGNSWVNLGVVPNVLSTSYLDNGIAIATLTDGHIWRSINSGLGWTDLGLVSGFNIWTSGYLGNGVALVIDNNGVIFRSVDFGLTWSSLGTPAGAGTNGRAITYLGNGVIIYTDSAGRILRSVDYGLTWTIIFTIGSFSSTAAYLDNGVVIVGTSTGRIIRSDVSYKIDEARATVHNDLLNRNLTGISAHDSELVGTLSPYSMNHNDIGKDWVLTTAFGFDIKAMEYLENGIVIASSDVVTGIIRLFRSTDHGRIFYASTEVSIGVGVHIRSISYFGSGIVVFGTDDGHIFRSTDFGLSFTDLGAISANSIIKIKYLGHGYAIALDAGGFVQRSINFGATWPLAIGVSAGMVTASYLDNGIAIVGTSNGHIWRSTTIFTGFPSFSDRGDVTGLNQTLVSLSYLGNGIVIVTTGNGHIIRSTDFGLNWTDLGLISASFFSNSAYLGNGVAICVAFNGHVWRSTDYGITWTDIVDITASTITYDILRYIGNGVIVIGDDAGNIFRSDISYKLDESIQDIEKPIRTILASETLAKGDETLLVDATAGNITIFLPSITVAPEHVFNFVRVDATANTVTIDAAGAETINLALTQPLNVQFMALSMKAKPFAPNAGWWII